jgi:shikimate kinase
MPGSGKTVVGRELAGVVGHTFVDLDEEVERLAGRPLIELFAEGEQTFRAVERRALEETLQSGGVVVATGGGALVDPEGLDTAMRAGFVVYLRAPILTLTERLSGRVDRPLLLDDADAPLSSAELAGRLEAMLKTRHAAYNRADVIVDVDEASPESLAREIARRLGV